MKFSRLVEANLPRHFQKQAGTESYKVDQLYTILELKRFNQ